MEKAPNVSVVLSDFGWSDLGTWASLYEKLPQDDAHNGAANVDLQVQESSGNVVVSHENKLVALRGLDGFIVVDTPDALLICPKSDEQWVKELVNTLKINRGEPLV
jgi:mannose-1-phosphate guanylyltransferase